MNIDLNKIAGLDDEKCLDELINFIRVQVSDEENPIALMANVSAFIKAYVRDLNWAGFYIVRDEGLILGPFQGLPACTRLSFDKGVCAKAYRDREIVKVDDVGEFKDHIVCDSNSKSELVIPIFNEEDLVCLIDLDSPKPARFTELELEKFREIGQILENTIYL
ncbi:Free methionine-R-sulfoxide reductase [Anaerococcus prevotii]|uniref:GAF sensor protein n=1 Tax=Anaerococcus prevotii (strain ATCC 9321 / DSM 20548 / JCM 6508 / NCTC 11806 / PC1) TaxID=525919 RepID=C7RHX3_ANAPD|nr:GAF domain-containing protein [Anaerococcus prevotii]ACV29084.1 putative GAF sensor protein [Anaerococcus prevotii DSM 20548]SUU94758.1 Free methionine-R-sulfoxide reductase [Anaerococcus prevotii]